jgi:hypothetical protein
MSSKKPILPWASFPEGQIVQYEEGLWVVRFGVVVNRPKRTKRFDDAFVALHELTAAGGSTLGYTLKVKQDFGKIFSSEHYLSLITDIKEHSKPKVLFDDQKIYLYRFNATKTPSYWFLVRHRA